MRVLLRKQDYLQLAIAEDGKANLSQPLSQRAEAATVSSVAVQVKENTRKNSLTNRQTDRQMNR